MSHKFVVLVEPPSDNCIEEVMKELSIDESKICLTWDECISEIKVIECEYPTKEQNLISSNETGKTLIKDINSMYYFIGEIYTKDEFLNKLN